MQSSEHDNENFVYRVYRYMHDPKNTNFFDTRYIHDYFRSAIKHCCIFYLKYYCNFNTVYKRSICVVCIVQWRIDEGVNRSIIN